MRNLAWLGFLFFAGLWLLSTVTNFWFFLAAGVCAAIGLFSER